MVNGCLANAGRSRSAVDHVLDSVRPGEMESRPVRIWSTDPIADPSVSREAAISMIDNTELLTSYQDPAVPLSSKIVFVGKPGSLG
jgi:hypothetical protein